jgi:hypothetical protein
MRWIVWLAGVWIVAAIGCGSTQRLTVRTDPPGARISLIKIGVRQAHGSLGEMEGMAQMQSLFEDEPIELGTSPLVYEFETTEPLASFRMPGGQAEVVKETRAGILRAVKAGQTAERRLQFTGQPLEVLLELSSPADPGEE